MKKFAVCQCGGLSAEIEGDDGFVVACNCQACQHRTGSPFGVGGYFQKSAVKIKGDEKTWSRSSDSGRGITNHFCANCGTTLYWDLDMRPDHFGIALGCFKTPMPDPMRVVWTEEKHAWVEFPDHWEQYPQATPGV